MPTLDRRTVALVAATAANFGAVLVGLWAISRFSNGDDQVALLNLWATWGIALGLIGQFGLISGVLDRRSWSSTRNVAWAFGCGSASLVVLLPLDDHLFAGRGSWTFIAAVMAGALYLLGRQRGALSIRQRGLSAVVVTAAENILRVAFLTGVLLIDRPALGSIAIVAPMALSFVGFAWLAQGGLELESAALTETRSIAVSLLAGVPAVLAYGVVPILTVLGNVDQLDVVAFAATLLRGPLIVAAFLAPWFLQRNTELSAKWRRGIIVAAALSVIGHVGFVAVPGIGDTPALLLAACAAACTAAAAYLLVILSPRAISGKTALTAAAVAVVTWTATSVVLRDGPNDRAFFGVAFASLAIVAIVQVASRSVQPSAAILSIGSTTGLISEDAA